MAVIEKRGELQWRARIRRKGYPEISRTFDTRKEAEAWARAMEREMDTGHFMPRTEAEKTIFSDFSRRYRQDILPSKKSALKIGFALANLEGMFGEFALVAITPNIVTSYRERRLKKDGVSGATVRKELSLLGRVLKAAMVDYGIHLPHGNPMASVRLPPDSAPRERRVSQEELDAIAAATSSPELPLVLRLATETAMRRGEIFSLNWSNIDLDAQVAHLPDSKNGSARDVPLSTRAVSALRSITVRTSGRVLSVSGPDSLTKAFSRAAKRAREIYERHCSENGEMDPDPNFLVGIRLHDLRHEATSRFFEIGLNVMEAASVTGHKDLRMLRRYTHLRATDLAKKLG